MIYFVREMKIENFFSKYNFYGVKFECVLDYLVDCVCVMWMCDVAMCDGQTDVVESPARQFH